MFDEGDWNNDGDFDSSEMILAFQHGKYVRLDGCRCHQ